MSNPMNAIIPTPTSTPGPQYSAQVSATLDKITVHDHTFGKGNQIPTNGLNINKDLPFNGFGAADMQSVGFRNLTAAIASNLLNRMFVVAGDIYFRDGSGRSIRFTQDGQIIGGAAGNIVGLVSPASASYQPSSKTFTWQSGANVPAAMDLGQLLLKNPLDNAHRIALLVATIAASYDLTLPVAPPSSALPMIGTPATGGVGLSFAQIVTDMLANVAVTTPKIADAAVTQGKVLQPTPTSTGIVPATHVTLRGVKYWVDVSGTVHLRGHATISVGVLYGDLILTLPTGAHPSEMIYVPTSWSPGAHGFDSRPVYIETNGEVHVGYQDPASPLEVYFDGVTFLAN
jgi:hypothetical protein